MIGRKEKPAQTREQKLAAKLSNAQLREYAETYLHSVGRGLSEFDSSRSTDQLDFAAADAQALAALLTELASRLNGE